jgi:tetratricopeptide (TPR) repeat protein/TolB-like protein
MKLGRKADRVQSRLVSTAERRMLWGAWLKGPRRRGPDRSQDSAVEPGAQAATSRRRQPAQLAPEPIMLAREPAFDLAGIEVRPASLEVVLPGRRELLEPRVMQVLTALARRRGEVVSRDDLIQACWEGRIVSDDAINRCISRIRKLAAASAGFEVQTIPKVGFRLSESIVEPAATPQHRRPWLFRAGAAAAALAAIAAAGWYGLDFRSDASPRPMRVAVEPFTAIGGDPGAAALSAELSDRLSGVLTKNVVGLALVAAGRPGAPVDLRMTGTVSREGANWRVKSTLQETHDNVALWTGDFQRPQLQEAVLREQVAVAAADVVDDAIATLRDKGWKPDPQSLALYLNARSAFQNATPMNRGEPRRLIEQAVARSPDFVAARAHLAIVLTSESARPGPDRMQLAQRARREAEDAIRRDPAAAGAAYDSLYLLARMTAPDDLAPAEDILIDGQAKAPGFAFLHMRRCQFLVEVGRAREAVPYCQRALAQKPLAAPLGYIHASALEASGAPELAIRAIESAARIRPDHELTQRRRFDIYAFSGSPEMARTMLRESSNATTCGCGLVMPKESAAALEAFLKARASQSPQDIDEALAALEVAEQRRLLPPRYLVFAATTLGRVDTAFSVLGRLVSGPNNLTAGDLQSLLTDAPAAPLQRDPRFWPLADKAKLVSYWRERDVWPDFCGDRTLPYDCRALAARTQLSAKPAQSATGNGPARLANQP